MVLCTGEGLEGGLWVRDGSVTKIIDAVCDCDEPQRNWSGYLSGGNDGSFLNSPSDSEREVMRLVERTFNKAPKRFVLF